LIFFITTPDLLQRPVSRNRHAATVYTKPIRVHNEIEAIANPRHPSTPKSAPPTSPPVPIKNRDRLQGARGGYQVESRKRKIRTSEGLLDALKVFFRENPGWE